MNHKLLLKIGLQYGLLLGIAFCLYTTIMWLTKLDTTYLYIGQYLDIAIILLPIILIMLGIRKFRNKGKKLTVWNRLYLALIIGIISTLIYEPFLYYYHEVINPDWFDSVLNLKQEQLLASGKGEEEIQSTIKELVKQNKARSGVFSAFIPSAIVIPIFAGLLSMLFVKNRDIK